MKTKQSSKQSTLETHGTLTLTDRNSCTLTLKHNALTTLNQTDTVTHKDMHVVKSLLCGDKDSEPDRHSDTQRHACGEDTQRHACGERT